MKDSYAVITGASQGLGRAFAAELAKENNNLILVSLPGQNLKEFAEELQTEYLVKTSCYETDLSIKENVMDLSEWINSKFSIHMLINNAGIGGSKNLVMLPEVILKRLFSLMYWRLHC